MAWRPHGQAQAIALVMERVGLVSLAVSRQRSQPDPAPAMVAARIMAS
jgi:hypothetical protein